VIFIYIFNFSKVKQFYIKLVGLNMFLSSSTYYCLMMVWNYLRKLQLNLRADIFNIINFGA